MKCYSRLSEKIAYNGNGLNSYKLLDDANGCEKGACAGISMYRSTDYTKPGVHADQEGFYIVEGTGWAKIGDEEFRIEPDTAFIAPAGVPHTIKRDPESVAVKVFWFHSAI